MMKRVIGCVAAFGFSLIIHVGLLNNFDTTPTYISQVTQATPAELDAISAFDRLDENRKSAELIDAASQALASEILEIETPHIEIPSPKAIEQKEANANKAPDKSNVKPSVSKTNSDSSQAKQNKPVAANQDSQNKQAYNSFQPSVRDALFRVLRSPRGVEAAKVVVLISFKNGRFSSASIESSSGNRELEKAVLLAAKKARYGTPPAGFSVSSQTFRIPIHIKN